MIATIQRIYDNGKRTISQWYVEDELVCVGLEDTFRLNKVYGETRIPAGIYDVEVVKEGRLYNRYKGQFGDWFLGMYLLKDVPNYTGIMIHPGIDEEDTLGCLLPGMLLDKELKIRRGTSSTAFSIFYKKTIIEALHGKLKIDIKDEE